MNNHDDLYLHMHTPIRNDEAWLTEEQRELSEMIDHPDDTLSAFDEAIKQASGTSKEDKEEKAAIAYLERMERNERIANHHKEIMREAWSLVMNNPAHYDEEMRRIASYMLDIVLENPFKRNQPQVWEHKYHLITRQVDVKNPRFGTNPQWVGVDGLPAEVPMKDLFSSNRAGTFASGYHIQIVGNRAVITADMESGLDYIQTPLGWTVFKGSMSFPVEWLYPTAVVGMMRGMQWKRVSFNTSINAETPYHMADKSVSSKENRSNDILSKGTFLLKLWVVANNKDKFKGFMDSRAGGGFTCMNVGYRYGKKGDGRRPSVEIIPMDVMTSDKQQYKAFANDIEFEFYHQYPQKPELTLEGAWQCDGKSNIYIGRILDYKQWYTFCQKNGSPSVNKVCARTDKLVIGARKVAPLGTMAMFIMKDVPEILKPVFVLGNCVIEQNQFKRIGQARLLSGRANIKGVGLPWDLKSLGLDIVAAKSFWKSDGNGILAMCAEGVSAQEQVDASAYWHTYINADMSEEDKTKLVDELNAEFKAKLDAIPLSTIVFPGTGNIPDTKVEGWYITEDVYASNLYITYGVRAVGETVTNGTDDEQEQNGFFSEVLLGFTKNPSEFNAIKAYQQAMKSKKYTLKRPVTQIKATDFMCVQKSYGWDVAKQLIDAAIFQYMSGKSYKRKIIQDIVLNGYGKDVPVVDMDVFNRICPEIFVGRGNKPITPTAGNFNEIERYDEGHSRWALLVEGSRAHRWPGLKNPKGMIVEQGQYRFYLPPWSVFEKHLDEDVVLDSEGNERVVRFLGESWTQLIVLMKAAYSVSKTSEKNTNWCLAHANFMARMNDIIINDVMNKLDVRGRYYTIMPQWWTNFSNVVTCTDPFWHKRKIKEVLYMKNPALFGNPIVNMILNALLPEGWINLDRDMMTALRTAIFVSVKFMLSRQDDCDGDQAVIMDLGGILPRNHLDKDSGKHWCQSYVEDELKLAIKVASYAPISDVDMHDGIIKSASGKRDTGVMTQNFFNVMVYMERFLNNAPIVNNEMMRLTIEAYATGVQDEAVRQIKQENSAASFFEHAALHANGHNPLWTNTKRVPDERGYPTEVVVEGRANLAAHVIIQRIKSCFKVEPNEQDSKDILAMCGFMMNAQSYDAPLKGAKFDKKAEAYSALYTTEKVVQRNSIMANRVACLFTGSYWENIKKTAPQWEAFTNSRAASDWEFVSRLRTKTGKPDKDASQLQYLNSWTYKHSHRSAMAYQYGWAHAFMHDSDVRNGWYMYNTWITEDGMDVSMWKDTIFGYMLTALKCMFTYMPPMPPKPESDSDAETVQDDTVSHYDNNKELITKLEKHYECFIFTLDTGICVQSPDNGTMDISLEDLHNCDEDSMRNIIKNVIGKLKLLRIGASKQVVQPAPVVKQEPKVVYPSVFGISTQDDITTGSSVEYKGDGYLVYGFSPAGRVRLTFVNGKTRIADPRSGVVSKDSLFNRNVKFPIVTLDGVTSIVCAEDIAIDVSNGLQFKPTKELLDIALSIYNKAKQGA